MPAAAHGVAETLLAALGRIQPGVPGDVGDARVAEADDVLGEHRAREDVVGADEIASTPWIFWSTRTSGIVERLQMQAT